MNCLTSGTIIVPGTQDWLRIQADTNRGYIDMSCFYSLHFRFTLLYEEQLSGKL